ncbi:MAG: DUF2062 domain-containing protein [Bacteroidetes bacterium]|nr:DUF2062 domain-containing protein [Bacteroidota bacterium]
MKIENKFSAISSVSKFFDRTLVTPLINFLKQGLSPQKLALCVALGLVLGTFPVLGSTTILCAIAALVFRLNMPAIQMINYFAYPLQLLLFIPFIRAGEIIFNQEPIPLDLELIFTMLRTDIAGAVKSLWWTNMRAIVVWGITVPPAGFVLYHIFVPLFLRLNPPKLEE